MAKLTLHLPGIKTQRRKRLPGAPQNGPGKAPQNGPHGALQPVIPENEIVSRRWHSASWRRQQSTF
jgi:hypothetical protein